jgi:hypothetical protein
LALSEFENLKVGLTDMVDGILVRAAAGAQRPAAND